MDTLIIIVCSAILSTALVYAVGLTYQAFEEWRERSKERLER